MPRTFYKTYRVVYPVKDLRTPEKEVIVLPAQAKRITGIAVWISKGLTRDYHNVISSEDNRFQGRIGWLNVQINNKRHDLGQFPARNFGEYTDGSWGAMEVTPAVDYTPMNEDVQRGGLVDLLYYNEWRGAMQNPYSVAVSFRLEE